jgi:hypothetical protein
MAGELKHARAEAHASKAQLTRAQGLIGKYQQTIVGLKATRDDQQIVQAELKSSHVQAEMAERLTHLSHEAPSYRPAAAAAADATPSYRPAADAPPSSYRFAADAAPSYPPSGCPPSAYPPSSHVPDDPSRRSGAASRTRCAEPVAASCTTQRVHAAAAAAAARDDLWRGGASPRGTSPRGTSPRLYTPRQASKASVHAASPWLRTAAWGGERGGAPHGVTSVDVRPHSAGRNTRHGGGGSSAGAGGAGRGAGTAYARGAEEEGAAYMSAELRLLDEEMRALHAEISTAEVQLSDVGTASISHGAY